MTSRMRKRYLQSLIRPRSLLRCVCWQALTSCSFNTSKLTLNDRDCLQKETRLDVNLTLATITWLIQNHADEFDRPDEAAEEWTAWASSHPTALEDVICKPVWEWPRPCTDIRQNLPADLATKVVTFNETIEYRNAISQTIFGHAQKEANERDLGDKKYETIGKDDFLWINPDAEVCFLFRLTPTLSHPQPHTLDWQENESEGWNAPFWIARTESAEDPDTVPQPTDAFDVAWWGAFSNNVLRDELNHKVISSQLS